MRLVVDASCLAKRLLNEPGSTGFRAWYHEEVQDGTAVLAPTLLEYELGNVIQRELREEAADLRERTLVDTLRRVRLVQPPMGRAFEIAGDLTYYDAAYVALALEEDAVLVTGDTVMQEAAEDAGVEVRVF